LYRLPKEHIELGDANEPNNVFVGRVIEDLPGKSPKILNEEISNEIVRIILDNKRMNFFTELLGGKKFVRRGQFNVMKESSFIGKHLDTDSNPNYDVAVVLQVGEDYSGGEFVLYPDDGSTINLKTKRHSLTVSKCSIRHEVKTVTSGLRATFVYFLADDLDPNNKDL
jgi:predicted 2-oxoglutarate/Fe(II)-dependent dioxygenase YbiX